MISNFTLGFFAIYLFSQNRLLSKYWSLFFLFMGLSAFVGGFYHGIEGIGEEVRFLSWSLVATAVVFAQFDVYKNVESKKLKWFFVIKAAVFLYLAIYYSNFSFMIIEFVISLIGFVIIGNWLGYNSISNLITYGVFISISSIVFKVLDTNIHPEYLTANDIGHYITVISLIVMSKGVKEDAVKLTLKTK